MTADLAVPSSDIDGRCITAIRMLSVDQVETAKSGHEGLPLGAAPMAWTVWSRFLRFDPKDATWINRDRFILSAGHGSALLYSLLHLFGYDLELSDLENFRQWGSRTPGHPEYGHTPGVETTTGPLGQGVSNATGMALAEAMLGARFNSERENIIDHRTFVIASDGDLMEGVSNESASLAGHLALGKLVVLYDHNSISIDGPTSLAFTEDVLGRYAALGWSTFTVSDGNDIDQISNAIQSALDDSEHPSIISVKTIIGFGAPDKQGTEAAHGGPYGTEEIEKTKERYGWPNKPFFIPDDVTSHLKSLIESKTAEVEKERKHLEQVLKQNPAIKEQLDSAFALKVPSNIDEVLPDFEIGTQLATRAASGKILKALSGSLPYLVGGSADLVESTSLEFTDKIVAPGNYSGSLIHFGVREHGMAAALNGLQLHGGFRVFGSTFLIFSDYLRPSLRLAALMGAPVIYIFTHDSVGLGQDGPTHQPIEQVESLRMVPNLATLRPADANEVLEAWMVALHRKSGPTLMALSRQALPVIEPGPKGWMNETGARVVLAEERPLEVVIIASGSEVSLALSAAEELKAKHNVSTRVVSVPWRERLLEQDPKVIEELIPSGALKVSIEAGVTHGWQSLVGPDGITIGINRFGASAPGSKVMEELGLSTDSVVARVQQALKQR
ncbi:MAG: transketolase [Actinobacteria bacterium]|nr:transketolase [Actinomycetota bacterium]